MFATTYVCEKLFSTMKVVKTKFRLRLTDNTFVINYDRQCYARCRLHSGSAHDDIFATAGIDNNEFLEISIECIVYSLCSCSVHFRYLRVNSFVSEFIAIFLKIVSDIFTEIHVFNILDYEKLFLTIETIRRAFVQSPKKSVRKCVRQLGLTKTTDHRALKKCHHLTPSELQLLHALHPDDYHKRYEFARVVVLR
ncbi:hypothetical protein ANN_05294 [Periplaneta americana]|uniref:Uncharacterized protein n=1 Tax=Periplaneta americana TaxID=6978 RepID=A0ABQ8TAR0_PERAM|nr:hypothetical protein ANN_05294 [Periplaneta americana]